ncbi:hypothetical protein CTAM01_13159 [Colletotrichum tamarilloi]|uniref:Uncharacterized protein n=1 Tax=Colletotrichum tamarilloi TaxID=1209934 RepID=A0ABQ9QSQ9_9PEZI|nr:uncharacterized protein CTAM01_13159 [Colletotrichum tamarilloi]KAK1483934.1 hypothetical protein CTAM01_13159 [Colletotrichum tamarilloi]
MKLVALVAISFYVATASPATLGKVGSPGSSPASTKVASGSSGGGGSGESGEGGGGRVGGEGEDSDGSNRAPPTHRGTASGAAIVQVPTASVQAVRSGKWVLVIAGLLMVL